VAVVCLHLLFLLLCILSNVTLVDFYGTHSFSIIANDLKRWQQQRLVFYAWHVGAEMAFSDDLFSE